MSHQPNQAHRIERLRALLAHGDFGGVRSRLGEALGYKSGAFVRQMLDGERPITEKTVLAAESMRGGKFRGWFSECPSPDAAGARAAAAARAAPPPIPNRKFEDRREVSETDWAVLQAVKLVLPEPELERIKREAERIRRTAAEQIDAAKGGG